MNYLNAQSLVHTSVPGQDTSNPSVLTLLGIGVCMLVPIVLSYTYFSGQSLRLDEAQSLWQSSRGFKDILTVVAGDVHVPFYHLLLRLWRLYVGDSVLFARLLSLTAYVLAIPAMYLLGSTAYNRRIGLFAAFLFSISPFMNWYGNEIRMYTIFTLMVILNQYFFLRLFKDKEPSDHVWSGYILTALFGVFTHYFFLLNLASQLVFYCMRRDLFARGSLKRFILTAVLVAAALIPWAWYVTTLGNAVLQQPLLIRPSSVDLFNAFSQFIFGFQNDNINRFLLSLWPIAVILRIFSLQRTERLTGETEYFLTVVVVSFAIAFFGSYWTPIFVSRYLIFTIPALYLILASLFQSYPARGKAIAQFSLACVMLLTLGIEIYNPTMPLKENYEEAVAYLSTHATAQDTILLSAPFTIYPVQYYYKGPSWVITLPIWNQYAHGGIPAFDPATLPEQAKLAVGASQNVYVLLSYGQGYEAGIKDYFDSHYQIIDHQTFSKDLDLYTYRLRYDTKRSAIAAVKE
jgi:mannosyltransferase